MAITNTLGAQVVFDGEVPRTFTATAREAVSGGQLVATSGATGDVGSSIASYANGDIQVIGASNAKLCNGMALNDAASGALVTVARRGDYLMRSVDVVSGGALIGHDGAHGVRNILNAGSVPVTTMADTIIGRAVTTSASGTSNYALVSLNL
jgi:hypothetical protein